MGERLFRKFFPGFFLVILSVSVFGVVGTNLWPMPVSVSHGGKTLCLDKDFGLQTLGSKYMDESGILKDAFSRLLDVIETSHVVGTNSSTYQSSAQLKGLNVVIFSTDDKLQFGTDESYKLSIPSTGKPIYAHLEAQTVYGDLHGLQTFSQLCQFNFTTRIIQVHQAPWSIADQPRFFYRGLLIDTSRHYLPLPMIKNVIDAMAYTKLNVLHWHIVDTQSFPLEIPSYPKLWDGAYILSERYTMADAAEIVHYAQRRGINVLAEIDVPGHALSWGTGYPDLWPSSTCQEPLDVSNEFTFKVLDGILSDFSKVFNFRFVHLGGDEVDTIRNCSSLVEIDLSNATELTDSAAAVIREAKNLEKLNLSRCKNISDMGIGCIAVECWKLKFISLKWCLGVTDLGVGLIAVKCKQLRSLDLSHVPITNKCLPSILQLPHLRDLVLVGCRGIHDEGLATLKQESTTLETLNLSNCENLSHDGFSSITNGARCIRQLIIAYGPPVTLALADSLQKLPMLQSLKLEGCQVSCSALKAIGNWCISLKELSLSKCLGVSDEGLSFLVKKHQELQKLDVTCCREITHVSIDSVTTSCPSLISLRMESCNLVSEEAFISIGQRCHFLEELDFTESEINNEGLNSISRCSRLSILKIGICLNITDEGLIHIGLCCPKLIELDLYRCGGITDLGIAAIASGCPKLETINIAYSKDITDNSLRSLSKCSKLNTLEIRGCPCISSTGLSFVAMQCKQLTKLDIKNCNKIDDAGMLLLAHFSQNLRQINLSYCSVTDIGVIALASICCLQNVTILHVKGLTPNGLAAALLACKGLTKAKLHISFKSKLSQAFLEHIESRGCAFQWRDKPFQVVIDARSWKRQLEDTL